MLTLFYNKGRNFNKINKGVHQPENHYLHAVDKMSIRMLINYVKDPSKRENVMRVITFSPDSRTDADIPPGIEAILPSGKTPQFLKALN